MLKFVYNLFITNIYLYICIIKQKQNKMTTKELKSILRDNRNVKLTIDNEWALTRNLDSMSGDTIYIEHVYNVDKWNSFDSNEYNKAIKFFMSKISYLKRFSKMKQGTDLEINIQIN